MDQVGKLPEIAIIAALTENRVIARDGKMPWHLPEDLRRFRRLTTGHSVLMGRTTFEALGKPLPQRRNVVLTSSKIDRPGVEAYGSISRALEALREQEVIWIIGGGTVYEQFLEKADRWELTVIEGAVHGDTFFPEYEHLIGKNFELAEVEERKGYRFETYRRMTG